jgi:4-hydroxy-tetrahydrodipicolinate reductase
MGLAMARLLPEFPGLQLTAALCSPGSSVLGQDLGRLAGGDALGVTLTAALDAALRDAQLVIDFSTAATASATIEAARAARVPLLIGTTGLAAGAQAQLDAAAASIPVLAAANTSVGVAVLIDLVRRAARALGPAFDVEIVEAHHRRKTDAPSGTALALGEAAATARGTTLASSTAPVRGTAGARRNGEIGFAVIRGGDVVGEHEVQFLGAGERIALRHSATDRSIFARGALRAGSWLAAQPAGRYGMADVFGI